MKFNGKPFHEVEIKSKICVVCDSKFSPKSGVHKFCSPECKGKWKYITKTTTTESQYKEISGNWGRYLSRLLYSPNRKKDGLSRETLLSILEKQKYKCALTGVELTCVLEKGIRIPTNASVDRIKAGGTYTKDNIQLVCVAVNRWRSDLDIDEFVEWCRKVVKHADGEGKVKDGQ